MALKNYRAVTSGQSLDDAGIVTFDWTGNTLRPLAPVNLRGSRNSLADLNIEWTRRSRLGAGLRPNSDVPLGEEVEAYLVEIYSGATLKRSMRVFPQIGVPVQLVGDPPSGVSGNNVLEPAAGQAHYALSLTTLNATDIAPTWVEASLECDGPTSGGGAYLKLAHPSSAPAAPLGSGGSLNPDFNLKFFNDTGTVKLQVIEDGVVKITETLADSPTSIRVRIELTGSDVRIFRDYSGLGSPPLYKSARIPVFPYKIQATADATGDGTRVLNIISGDIVRPSVVYTAAQQTLDFGSTQSSIKVRVYQISSIVGLGSYVEGTL